MNVLLGMRLMRRSKILEIEVLMFDVEGLRDTVLGEAMILQ